MTSSTITNSYTHIPLPSHTTVLILNNGPSQPSIIQLSPIQSPVYPHQNHQPSLVIIGQSLHARCVHLTPSAFSLHCTPFPFPSFASPALLFLHEQHHQPQLQHLGTPEGMSKKALSASNSTFGTAKRPY